LNCKQRITSPKQDKESAGGGKYDKGKNTMKAELDLEKKNSKTLSVSKDPGSHIC
jgi:hypothetical protein